MDPIKRLLIISFEKNFIWGLLILFDKVKWKIAKSKCETNTVLVFNKLKKLKSSVIKNICIDKTKNALIIETLMPFLVKK